MLGQELERAALVDPEDAPVDLVQLQSIVAVTDLERGSRRVVQRVRPGQRTGRACISVVTPLAAALIGLRAGDTFSWRSRRGRRRSLRIDHVTPDPLAVAACARGAPRRADVGLPNCCPSATNPARPRLRRGLEYIGTRYYMKRERSVAMDKGADWLAANDHPKGRPPAAVKAWVRARGETWYRPAAPLAGETEAVSDAPPQHRFIAAGRVAGAPVYSPEGRRLGRIAEIAIDDATGEVAFVLLAAGGFLGFGERLRRLPWSALTYRPRAGYVLDTAQADIDPILSLPARVAFAPAADRGGWRADA